ncbi:unnamed protein product [Paramecium pentaurelia]|uniref:AN1-type domain-containing protein n=1 Tax=Paramecium pentaurelia TaxID=43138 RepID=A0A8S1URS7_9CILI|nr:unnamed protein product [Paramecium pentaurelia]
MLDYNIGKRCQYSICRQKDFLPYSCSLCNNEFCKEHRTPEAHECTKLSIKKQVLKCPICEKGISYTSDQNENMIWEEHFQKDCPQQPKEKKFCPICKNKLTDLNRVQCKDCGMEICLKHRQREDHRCPTLKKIEDQQNQNIPQPQIQQVSNEPSFQQLLDQQKLKQQQIQKQYQPELCPVCGMNFPYIMQVIRHVEMHHS